MSSRKITHRDISKKFEDIVKPSGAGRSSIGIGKQVGEYFFLDVKSLIPYKNQARKIFGQQSLYDLAESIKNMELDSL